MTDYFDQLAARSPAPDANISEEEPSEPNDQPALSEPLAADSTPASLKSAVQEILRCGLVESASKPNLYRTLERELNHARRILEPFDLEIQLDDIRGIAFLKLPAGAEANADEAWSHPLVRRQRRTTAQSLPIAILRQHYIGHEQEHGLGVADAVIDADELQAQFDTYLGPSGSDTADSERLKRIVSQLHVHGIVSEPDKDGQIQIRPIIVHLANPEQLSALLAHFTRLATKSNKTDFETSQPPETSDDCPEPR